MSLRQVPVLDIGGTHVTAAVVDGESWRVLPGSVARSALDAAGTAWDILAALAAAAATVGSTPDAAWGIAIPGPFDYARGIADYHGVAKFDALRGVDLGVVLGRAIGGRCHFLNDAEAFAVGEWLAGAGQGQDRMIGITLGTGVGSAFLVDGAATVEGPGVAPGGRVDLVRIEGAPLEDTVSRRAILRRYRSLAGPAGGSPDVREIAALARAGDAEAGSALAAPLHALGRVLGPLARDFRAGAIVVGGSIALAWDLVEPALRAGMVQASGGGFIDDGPLIIPAQHPDESALVGAARHAYLRET